MKVETTRQQAIQQDQPNVQPGIHQSGQSYYVMADIQSSSGRGPVRYKVDRQLAEIVAKCLESGGRIGVQEAHEILAAIKDGGRYGEGEKAITRGLLAACDDRKHAFLNGDRLNITEPAELVLKRELPKWWGGL